MSKEENWVDNKFLQRLQSRTVQPGVVRLDMGSAVMDKVGQMTQPPPLVQVVGQRWQSSIDDQQAQLPFVYAQPAPKETPTAVSPISATAPIVTPTQTAQPAPKPVGSSQQTTKPTVAQPKAAKKAVSTPISPATESMPKLTAVTPPKPHQPQPVEPAQKDTKAVDNPTTTLSLSKPSQPQPSAAASSPVLPTKDTTLPGTAAQPLPVVKAIQVTPSTAVSQPAPTITSAKQAEQPDRTPASATPTQPQPLKLVTPQMAAPAVALVQTKQAAQSAANGQTERPLVRPQTQSATPSTTPSARPVVIKPRSTARKAPISFPSPAPEATPANGRSTAPNLPDRSLPVVRTERSQTSQQTKAQALPLPKTAVVTPSPSSQPASHTPVASDSSSSGVIQRQENDEVPEATNAPTEAVDIDTIVSEVQRQFMRELAIESERRGVTSWY